MCVYDKCNLYFAEGVFKETFRSLKMVPDVLYPSINSNLFDDIMKTKPQIKLDGASAKHLFVSINRFEPKKNIALAIRTLSTRIVFSILSLMCIVPGLHNFLLLF